MPIVGLIHSTRLIIDTVHRAVSQAGPEVEIIHTLDEGLLKSLQKKEDHRIARRLTEMAEKLEEDGADLNILTCSSLSPYVNEIRKKLRIPLLKIDEPMIEWAVQNHQKIGVVMTNPTTYEPTTGLLREVAGRLGKEVKVEYNLCEQAFSRLNHGDVQGHDAVVIEAVETLLREVEVVLLAQVSIARIIEQVNPEVRERVFSSLNFINTLLARLE
ncbi:MAG TPA: aspartate/glutamate racemase family protein [Bacillota bacterium]